VLIASSVTLSLYATDAFAADATCESQAAEKKLAGAAMTSFMKCEKDDQKLAGAAKTSFTKK
jgi:hypothetical protein